MSFKYPRIGCIATNDPESHTPEGQKRTAQYHYAAHSKDPAVIEGVHRSNPDIQIAFEWMPQFIPGTNRYGEYPWNLKNYIADTAEKNGWVLFRKGTTTPVTTWGWRWLNFTSQCPKDDQGRTIQQWLAETAHQWLILGGVQGWGPWGSPDQYDMTLFDLIFDTIWDGWLGNQVPEYDGTEDAFRDDWANTTHEFLTLLRSLFPYQYQIQAGGDSHMPPPSDFDGIKQEDALIRFPVWEEEYDGRQKPNRQRGLLWARDTFRNMEAWSLFQTRVNTASDPQDQVDQWVRYTLGTCMMTDAIYVCVDSEETGGGLTDARQPFWHELYDLDFGTFGGQTQTFGNGVRIRDFWEGENEFRIGLPAIGRVVLNPTDKPQGGVPPRDALFMVQERDWVRTFVDIFTWKHANQSELEEATWVEAGIRTCDVDAIEALCRRELGKIT